MVVIGIDLGTTNSCVAVYLRDRVEVLVNDHGDRTTPSVVSFDENETIIGKSAKGLMGINPENTIYETKRMIGKRFNEASVNEDKKLWPFTVIDSNGKPAIRVLKNGQQKVFHPEEISAIILDQMNKVAKLRIDSEFEIKGAVITVPTYKPNREC